MKAQKTFWSVISVIMTVAMLAACTSAGAPETTQAATSKPTAAATKEPAATQEPVTLSITLLNEGLFTDIETNTFTLWLEEQTGAHLEFTILEEEVAQEKMLLSLNSGSYTDIIANHINRSQQIMYGMEEGIFIPLNDYIENSTYYKVVTERYPTLVTDMMLSDGNIYGMCGVQDNFHSMEKAGKLYINVNWLENLDLEMPATTEEFAEVLRAFRDEDANGDGDTDDEIPMSGCVPDWASYPHTMLMNAFCCYADWYSTLYYNEDTGEVMGTFEQEGFQDGLAYVAGLYAEGLIDPAAYTQNNDDFEAQLADCETIGAYNKGHMGTVTYDVDATAYELVLPLEGPSGRCGIPWSDEVIETGAKLVITDACQNPDAAFAWADFLFSDAASWNQFYGPQGELWDYADSGTTLKGTDAEFLQLKSYLDEDVDPNCRWGFQRLGQHDFQTRTAVTSDDIYDSNNYVNRLAAQSVEYAAYAIDTTISVTIAEEDSEEYSQLNTAIQSYYVQAVIEFIAGRRDVEDDWDEFISDMNDLGWERYMEIYMKNYRLSKYYKGNW